MELKYEREIIDEEEREQYKNDLNNEDLSIAERKKAYDALIADLLNNFYISYITSIN